MIEVQILIPVGDNAGAAFAPSHDAVFEAFLATEFGGYSRLPGTVAGGWIDRGVYYPDAHRVYVVALPGITDGAKVRVMAEFAKAHYAQLNVYVRYLGLSEIL